MSMYDPIIKAIHNAAQKIKGGIDSKISHKADLDSDGLVPLSQLPPATMEHMVTVADDTARFALTTSDVQNGDTVYVDSTEQMYMVVDDTNLSSETGYKAYAAGTATRAIADKNGADITTTYQTSTLGSWTAGSATSHSTPASTDTVLEALEKIDNNQRLDETNISSQQNTIADGGNGYALVNGIRVYVSATEPTGTIPDGSIWIRG